jgi:hypothetical protein
VSSRAEMDDGVVVPSRIEMDDNVVDVKSFSALDVVNIK